MPSPMAAMSPIWPRHCVRAQTYEPESMTGALVYNDTFWAYDSVGLRHQGCSRKTPTSGHAIGRIARGAES